MDIDPKLLKEFDKMSQEASGKRVKTQFFFSPGKLIFQFHFRNLFGFKDK